MTSVSSSFANKSNWVSQYERLEQFVSKNKRLPKEGGKDDKDLVQWVQDR